MFTVMLKQPQLSTLGYCQIFSTMHCYDQDVMCVEQSGEPRLEERDHHEGDGVQEGRLQVRLLCSSWVKHCAVLSGSDVDM